MIIRDYRPSINDPNDLKNWILKATRHIPLKNLKNCKVDLTHVVRNKLFTTLGVAGGEDPQLFGVPIRLVSGSEFGAVLHLPE